jgi:hypothetical protein
VTVPAETFMPAPAQTMKLWQGDTKRTGFRVRFVNADGTAGDAVDLTGCTALAQIRSAFDAAVMVAFTAAPAADQVGSKGVVTMSLTAAQTAALAVPVGVAPDAEGFFRIGVWDVQLTYPDGRVQTYHHGPVLLHPEVSR